MDKIERLAKSTKLNQLSEGKKKFFKMNESTERYELGEIALPLKTK